MCYELFETNGKKEVGQKVRDDAWVCSDLDLTNACSITRAPQCKCVYATLHQEATGYRRFAECRRHSVKPKKHSAKGLPSVTLGKGFAECYTRQTLYRQTLVCRVFFVGHSAKTLPSVQKTLGKLFFKKNK